LDRPPPLDPRILVPEHSEHKSAHVELEQAEGAELLVVGSRGQGTAKPLMLGSVSHDLAIMQAVRS
jgi:nucleotide-binding universal stress UspA family protein